MEDNQTVTVTPVIKLNVKGVEIELTKEEAQELRAALSALFAEHKPAGDSDFKKIVKKLKEIKDAMPADRIVPIPQPYPVRPVWPKYPLDRPYSHEFWCSTSNNIRMSVTDGTTIS